MAVYSKLLLSAGGGIISAQQQAKQVQKTATVLIGLGGTGVHCIRTIKTQVYSRLKPDDEKAVVPTYSHIRFLGVDTAVKSRGGALKENQTSEDNKKNKIQPLDDTEFFSIANRRVADTFKNKKATLKLRPDLNWLDYENISVPNLGDAGAGGIRQIGRFMMMDKAQQFLTKLEHEIKEAKSGLGDCRVNIHIFSGLSGGTGSGCFLDVCYLVRSVAERIGGINIYGYFFLPDVNLSNVALDNENVRQFIPKNGYASMQELDYCMALPQNGGSFKQVYQGDKVIQWCAPPVDMCHLICATDENHSVIPNAYDYAMNVTAEYVMDFLTDTDEEFGLPEHLSNFRSMVGEADEAKKIGSEMAYCVIGASCASIPLREINTYLASELFGKFATISSNVPREADVEELAIAALAKDARSIKDIYNSLLRELREGFDESYAPYGDDWRFVRDYGNEELMLSYTNQTAEKLNKAEVNATSMMTPSNRNALITRVNVQLHELIQDISYGPAFAYGLISAAEKYNLLNIIDGLLEENASRYSQEKAQTSLREEEYEGAKSDFENRRNRKLFDSDVKRFGDYEWYLMRIEQHKLRIGCFEKMNELLNTFRRQLETAAASYYIKLRRVVDTLIDTFKANRDALADEKVLQSADSFAVPLMTITHLKHTLDDEIKKTNIPGMLKAFMRLLLDNPDVWIAEDENRIARLVNDFFVDTAFEGFANRTITNYLKDKYENTRKVKLSDAELTEAIYEDWMKMLTDKANPLFCFDTSLFNPASEKVGRIAFLSFPKISSPIKEAAKKMQRDNDRWKPKESELTDRIFVMHSVCGLPLGAYNDCTEYQRMFFSAKTPGRHYYNDWYNLPSITPQVFIDTATAPPDLAKLVESARALYEKARALKVLDDEGYVCSPGEEAIGSLKSMCTSCEKTIEKAHTLKDAKELADMVVSLEHAEEVPMIRTGMVFPHSGSRATEEIIDSVLKDHFVYSPALHGAVQEIVDEIEPVMAKANTIRAQALAKKQEIEVSVLEIANYCDALFTGVISLSGRVISYRKDSYDDPTILSQYDFPYAKIPVYQGFLSYLNKLDAETKETIKKTVGMLLDADSPELAANAAKLKATFSDDVVESWREEARHYADTTTIHEFIKDFMQRFSTFCKQNRI